MLASRVAFAGKGKTCKLLETSITILSAGLQVKVLAGKRYKEYEHGLAAAVREELFARFVFKGGSLRYFQ